MKWTFEGEVAVAARMLDVVMRHQRRSDALPACERTPCTHCRNAHLGSLVDVIDRRQPATFVLPGFPGKSPNLRKVLGPLPDLGEQLALDLLQSLADEIQRFYEPGARFIICSDGRVFSDLVRISDADITGYQDAILHLIREKRSLRLFNLDDVWRGADFGHMRQQLCRDFGESPAAVRERVQQDPDSRALYLGITRFLFEDAKGIPEMRGVSNTVIQKESRVRAYGVLQRSNAWSELIKEQFPTAVRLSIHPQRCGSPKLGIKLGASDDSWMTPWHSVAVKMADRYVLMKRSDAEAQGAALVRVNGRPSHFELVDWARLESSSQDQPASSEASVP